MFKSMVYVLVGIMLFFFCQLFFGFGDPIATIDLIFAQIYTVMIVGVVTFIDWVEKNYGKKKETP